MDEHYPSETLKQLKSIDLLCIEFEDAWLCGNRPRVSNFTSKVPPEERDSLTKELLYIEWHALRCRKEKFSLEDYSNREDLAPRLVEEAWECDQARIATTAPDLALLGDRYSIVKTHARGGLGQVYEANDNEVGRRVAIKEVRREYFQDPESQERLLREARITGRLEHPGIIPVFSIGANDLGNPFYSMRFIEGDSLLEAIEQFFEPRRNKSNDENATTFSTLQQPQNKDARSLNTEAKRKSHHAKKLDANAYRGLKFKQMLGRFVYACRAIQYAHSRGILHRDLKPSNIMLGQHGETIVVDWGLAKEMRVEDSEASPPPLQPVENGSNNEGAFQTNHGTVLGTLGYVSPEQAAGQLAALTPASDVFSLGASLFHLLTGQRPDQNPSSLRSIQPSIPQPLVAICRKAMASEPATRYQTAEAFADDLERWLADEPVSALRESVIERWQRWSRNNRTMANWLIGGLLLVIVAATNIGLLNANLARKTSELEAAKTAEQLGNQATQAERDKKQSIGNLLVEILGISDDSPDGPIMVADFAYENFLQWIMRPDTDPEARITYTVKVMETLNASNLSEKVAKVGSTVKKFGGFEELPIEKRCEFYRFWLPNLVKNNQHEIATRESNSIWNLLDESKDLPSSVIRTLVESQLAYCRACIISVRPNQALDNLSQIKGFISSSLTNNVSDLETIVKIRSAQAYLGLNQPQRASKELKSIDPLDQNHTHLVQLEIAKTYSQIENYDESLKILDAASEAAGSDSIPLLRQRFDIYIKNGKTNQAENTGKKLMNLAEQQFGKNSEAFLMAQRNLELFKLNRMGNNRQAFQPLEENLKKLREVNGDHDPFTLQTQEELALLKIRKLFDTEALELLKTAREQSELHFNKFSPRWLESSQKFAIGLRSLSRTNEAIGIYYEILNNVEGRWEASSYEMRECRKNLAAALAANQQHSKALALLRPECDFLLEHQNNWGSNDWITINNYLFTLKTTGDVESQAKCIARIENSPEKTIGWEQPPTLAFKQILAIHYEDTGRPEEAKEIYQDLIESLSKRETESKDIYATLLNVKYNYAICRVKMGEASGTDAMDALNQITDFLGKHPTADIYRESLARTLFNLHAFEHAKKIYQHLVEHSFAERDKTRYGEYLCQLGLCEYQLGDIKAAISNLRKSLHFRTEHMDGDWTISYTKNCLGRALSAANKNDEAARLLEESLVELESHQFPSDFRGDAMVRECVDATIAFFHNISDHQRVVDYKKRECQILDQFSKSKSKKPSVD